MVKIEENVKCPCRWKNCKRHGDCTACKEHHQKVKKDCLPACERRRKSKRVRGERKPNKRQERM